MDINELGKFIETGEHLEEHYDDRKVGYVWFYDVSNFLIENKKYEQISHHFKGLDGSFGMPDKRNHFDAIMGFLRSIYERS